MIGAPLSSKHKNSGRQSIRTEEIPINKKNIIDNDGLDDMLSSVIMDRHKSCADAYVREYLSNLDSKSVIGMPVSNVIVNGMNGVVLLLVIQVFWIVY